MKQNTRTATAATSARFSDVHWGRARSECVDAVNTTGRLGGDATYERQARIKANLEGVGYGG
jgi:hypothetical protein